MALEVSWAISGWVGGGVLGSGPPFELLGIGSGNYLSGPPLGGPRFRPFQPNPTLLFIQHCELINSTTQQNSKLQTECLRQGSRFMGVCSNQAMPDTFNDCSLPTRTARTQQNHLHLSLYPLACAESGQLYTHAMWSVHMDPTAHLHMHMIM
jgi:hypothetical protein